MADPTHVLDHVGLDVADVAASHRFYEAALAPLGFTVVMKGPEGTGVGYGLYGKPALWIRSGPASGPVHVGFHASDRARVSAFHSIALRHGGVDNGPPGLRPHYHAHYYAAFVLDPDGNNVEAVCHMPQG